MIDTSICLLPTRQHASTNTKLSGPLSELLVQVLQLHLLLSIDSLRIPVRAADLLGFLAKVVFSGECFFNLLAERGVELLQIRVRLQET
jgi:hypothetical protein